MMRFRLLDIEFSAHFLVVALMSLCLVTDTTFTVCACFLSAVTHECGHLFAMALCRVKLRKISLRAFDIVIKADTDKSFSADLLITLCGPLFNLIFAILFINISQKICYSNLVIGMFNILPVKTFDGGHALYIVLCSFLSEKSAEIVLNIITFLFLVPFFIFGILLLFECKYNYSLLLICLYLTAILFMK